MKKQIIEIAKQCAEDHGSILTYPYEDDIAERLYIFCNQEVERRIKERMPSEEEIKEEADLLYSKEIFIMACKWLRSRLTSSEKPNNSQKTEGGAK